MSKTLFIVDGLFDIRQVLQMYNLYTQIWEDECQSIKDSFFPKTSRVATDIAKTNFKEYTYWYRTKSYFGIERCGNGIEKPDIESYYPPKPEHPIQFEYQDINDRHILISSDDLESSSNMFVDSYIFHFDPSLTPFDQYLILCGGSDVSV